MPIITAPRGTADVLPVESARWRFVEQMAREAAELFNYGEIRTPVYEHSELFHRGVGETSDIVQKETFTFRPRPESDSITLRPEGTAGVVRAAIEHGLLAQEGARVKVYYLGPNFRYERPQKGRLRIHHQFGAEAFGLAEPEQDAECILLQLEFYRRCGLRNLTLHVNSLGDKDSKLRYAEALRNHLQPLAGSLSEDSQRRLTENPLRILDSKDPRDVQATANVPAALASLSEKSRQHFERLQALLTSMQVPFQVNPRLVRGFDYYTETLWEIVAEGLGSQNAVGGGGRYDNLVEQLGGKPTPAVGFGTGLERLLLALEAQGVQFPTSNRPLTWLASHGPAARDANLALLQQLRIAGIPADMDLSGRSMKAQMKLADRNSARFCLITGDAELQAGTIVLKDLSTGQQSTLNREDVIGLLCKQISA